MIINLVSNPRNLSTALMYSFAQRSDTTVIDEPHYGVYLTKTGYDHPGREDILNALPHSEQAAMQAIDDAHTKPVLFLKNMAHHIRLLDSTDWMRNCFHVLYIRDPRRIIASFSQVITAPTVQDVGMDDQYQVWQYLRDNQLPYCVLNSDDLLQDAEATLSKLCSVIGIPFEPQMLHWPSGPKAYDGVWWPYWYASVHKSTGFISKLSAMPVLGDDLLALAEQCHPYYDALQNDVSRIYP